MVDGDIRSMGKDYQGNTEATLDELLNDEIAGLLRVRDGLSLDDVFCIVQRAREALRGRL